MRLLGEFQQKLDDKGRTVLPSTFRDALDHTKLILALGDHGELGLWPEEDFDRRAAQKAEVEYLDAASALAYRQFMSNAGEARLDGQGRIAISESLRRKAGLVDGAAADGQPGSRNVVVIGVGNRVEIWEKHRYDAFNGSGVA